MDFSKYTTQEIEFITSNFESLKKELEKRYKKELGNFPFKTGDIIHSKLDNDNYLIKIKEIDKRKGNVFADEITIRDDGSFDIDDGWYEINSVEWYEYTKIEDSEISEIFENLRNIIYKYDNAVQQLTDNAYLKLKKEIAPYDYNV